MEEVGTPITRVPRGVVYVYLHNIVGALMTIIYLPILVRSLSQEEVGVTVTLGMILTLVLTLNSFSIPKAVTKYVAEFMGRGKFSIVKSLYKRSIQLSLGFGGASALVLLLFYSVFFSYLTPIGLSSQPVILLSVDIMISSVLGFLNSLLYGLQRFKEIAIIGVLSLILRVSSVIVLLYLGYGVPGVIAGWIIGDLTGMALSFFYARNAVKAFMGAHDEGVTMSSLFEYSLPLYGASILGYLSTYIDRFLLLSLIGLSKLAVYSVAVIASSFLSTVSYPITYVLFPFFSELYGKNSNRSLQIASLKATRYTSLIFVPMAIGLATVSYPMIRIFTGTGYTEATLPLTIICLTMAFTQVGVAITPTLLSLGRTRVLFNAQLLGILVNTIVVLMSAPLIGIKGVALGRAGLMMAGFGYTVYVLARSYGFYWDKEALIKAWIGSLTMAIMVFVAQSYFSFDMRLTPLYVLLGFVTYIAIIRWLKVINYEDSLFFKNLLPRRFGRAPGLLTRLFGIKSPDPKEA